MKYKLLFIASVLLLISCSETEARRPISQSKSYTLADTSEKMKEINKRQEAIILSYVKNDSLTEYSASPNGYWYSYINKIEQEAPTPQEEDVVELSYEILDLNDQVIYAKEELGTRQYKVDKEDFIPALQTGIKMMKAGETVKFVIPSYNAFGVVGDEDKIGINQSIISIVTLLNINEENED
jgi:gliding motility-associated peptidyl-prolyl isomerase